MSPPAMAANLVPAPLACLLSCSLTPRFSWHSSSWSTDCRPLPNAAQISETAASSSALRLRIESSLPLLAAHATSISESISVRGSQAAHCLAAPSTSPAVRRTAPWNSSRSI